MALFGGLLSAESRALRGARLDAQREKKAKLIDTLEMDNLCAVCGRQFALLMRKWPRDHNPDYWRFLDTCSEFCTILRRRRMAKQPLLPRQCPGCEEQFVPKRRDAIFCSTRCRVRGHRRAIREVRLRDQCLGELAVQFEPDDVEDAI